MIFGMSNSPMRDVLDEVDEAARLGFDYMELNMDAPRSKPAMLLARKDALLAKLEQKGLGLPVAHMPIMVYTASMEDALRRVSVEITVEAAKAAKNFGIQRVVLHPSLFFGLGLLNTELSRRLAEESLDIFMEAAAALDIVVCLENLFPETHYLIEAWEFSELLERYPQLMLTLDIGHANIGAHPNRSFDFIRSFFDRIGHVHLTDNLGRGDEHLPLGAGNVPIRKIMEALKSKGYDKAMTIEVFSPDRDYVRMSLEKAREWWEKI